MPYPSSLLGCFLKPVFRRTASAERPVSVYATTVHAVAAVFTAAAVHFQTCR